MMSKNWVYVLTFLLSNRLQSYIACGKGNTQLETFKAASALLNTVTFHTRMVDSLEDLLADTSCLSLFCFYSRLFEDHFQMCLEFPAQNR